MKILKIYLLFTIIRRFTDHSMYYMILMGAGGCKEKEMILKWSPKTLSWGQSLKVVLKVWRREIPWDFVDSTSLSVPSSTPTQGTWRLTMEYTIKLARQSKTYCSYSNPNSWNIQLHTFKTPWTKIALQDTFEKRYQRTFWETFDPCFFYKLYFSYVCSHTSYLSQTPQTVSV